MAVLRVPLQLSDGWRLKQVKLEQVWAPDKLRHRLCCHALHTCNILSLQKHASKQNFFEFPFLGDAFPVFLHTDDFMGLLMGRFCIVQGRCIRKKPTLD